MEIFEGKACRPGEGRIGIVVSKYNRTITDNLLKGALEKLKEFSIDEDSISIIWVPGAFELPQMAQRLLLDQSYLGVICLGCVIKGETSHDQHINRAVSLVIEKLATEFCIPISFGLLTCDTVEQAYERSGIGEGSHDKAEKNALGNKGVEAALALLEMINLNELLPPLEFEDEEEMEYVYLPGKENRKYNEDDFGEDDFGEDDFEDDVWEEVDAPFPRQKFRKEKKSDKDYPSHDRGKKTHYKSKGKGDTKDKKPSSRKSFPKSDKPFRAYSGKKGRKDNR